MELGKHEIPIGYYCVPSAIMLLTGLDYEQVRSAINEVRGSKLNRGLIRVHTHHAIEALKKFGIEIETAKCGLDKPLGHCRFKGAWIIETYSHWIAVCDNEVADTRHIWWTPIKECSQRMKRVKRAWKLTVK